MLIKFVACWSIQNRLWLWQIHTPRRWMRLSMRPVPQPYSTVRFHTNTSISNIARSDVWRARVAGEKHHTVRHRHLGTHVVTLGAAIWHRATHVAISDKQLDAVFKPKRIFFVEPVAGPARRRWMCRAAICRCWWTGRVWRYRLPIAAAHMCHSTHPDGWCKGCYHQAPRKRGTISKPSINLRKLKDSSMEVE